MAGVRIEMSDSVSWNPEQNTLKGVQALEIRLERAAKPPYPRKPDVRLVAESRHELLRHLANWIEQEDDPDLLKLTGDYQQTMP